MTLQELNTILEGTGLPVAYDFFPEDECPEMPFIVYRETRSDNFGADNKVWFSKKKIMVDLLTYKKDIVSENLLEETFNNNDLYWVKDTGYDDGNKHNRITYETEI